MNLLWIEDFGDVSDHRALASEVFRAVIPEETWDEWEGNFRASDANQTLNEFTLKHTDNKTKCHVCRNYGEYNSFIKHNKIDTDIDAILIDIRLDGYPEGDLLPSGYSDTDKFQLKAGLYIYNHLLRSGYPPDRMCLITGQGDTLTNFIKGCREIYLPSPRYTFEKSEKGKKGLDKWLFSIADTPALRLRRGILEGTEEVIKITEMTPDILKFGKRFLPQYQSKDHISNNFSPKEAIGQLSSLALLSNSLEYSHHAASASILRSILYIWDKTTYSVNPGIDNNLLIYLDVLKNARNFAAHSNIFDQPDPKLVALLFLAHMRASYDLGKDNLRYENVLLDMFSLEHMDHNLIHKQFIDNLQKYEERTGNSGAPTDRPLTQRTNTLREFVIKHNPDLVEEIPFAFLLLTFPWKKEYYKKSLETQFMKQWKNAVTGYLIGNNFLSQH